MAYRHAPPGLGAPKMTMALGERPPGRGVTRPALLDVNVLVALFNPDHVHHDAAQTGLRPLERRMGNLHRHRAGPPASPGESNLLVRVRTHGRAGQAAPPVLRQRPVTASGSKPSRCAIVTLFDLSHLSGHRQITDVYLLGLAHKMGGQLATFDRTIPLKAVIGATSDSMVDYQGQTSETSCTGTVNRGLDHDLADARRRAGRVTW